MYYPVAALIVPLGLGMVLVDMTNPGGPLSELGPIAQLGVAGIILGIWWIERKERRDRQIEDDRRYSELQDKLLKSLARPVRCPMVKDDDQT